MMRKVVRHETRDEVIAMVVARVTPQRQRVPCRIAGLLQQLRP